MTNKWILIWLFLFQLFYPLGVIPVATAKADIADMRVQQIGPAMAHPWGMSFVDEDTLLISLRGGQLMLLDMPAGKVRQIKNVPKVFARGQGGLLDVLISHDDADMPAVFLCYSKPVPGGVVTALDVARLDGNALAQRKTLFEANDVSPRPLHFGCRLAISDGYLYLSIGDRGQRDNAQSLDSHAGSVVRLHLDGRIPDDNPIFKDGASGLFTKGHRNPQGIAVHPQTNDIWINEHGPKGGDEINILKAGANYGWPLASFGREYYGGPIGDGVTSLEGYKDSVWHWTPSIAPSGMAFYNTQMFTELSEGLLVTSLKFRRLYHVELVDGLPNREQIILDRRIGRIRDVEIAPDGSILLLSDEVEGGLYRLYK